MPMRKGGHGHTTLPLPTPTHAFSYFPTRSLRTNGRVLPFIVESATKNWPAKFFFSGWTCKFSYKNCNLSDTETLFDPFSVDGQIRRFLRHDCNTKFMSKVNGFYLRSLIDSCRWENFYSQVHFKKLTSQNPVSSEANSDNLFTIRSLLEWPYTEKASKLQSPTGDCNF